MGLHMCNRDQSGKLTCTRGFPSGLPHYYCRLGTINKLSQNINVLTSVQCSVQFSCSTTFRLSPLSYPMLSRRLRCLFAAPWLLINSPIQGLYLHGDLEQSICNERQTFRQTDKWTDMGSTSREVLKFISLHRLTYIYPCIQLLCTQSPHGELGIGHHITNCYQILVKGVPH